MGLKFRNEFFARDAREGGIREGRKAHMKKKI